MCASCRAADRALEAQDRYLQTIARTVLESLEEGRIECAKDLLRSAIEPEAVSLEEEMQRR